MLPGLFLTPRFFRYASLILLLFLPAMWLSWLLWIAYLAIAGVLLTLLTDIYRLYVLTPEGPCRVCDEKFSNGDANPVLITFFNPYSFSIKCEVVDELPMHLSSIADIADYVLTPGETRKWTYEIKPVKRGHYVFGQVHIFCESSIGLARRRVSSDSKQGSVQEVRVYPSYRKLPEYTLMATIQRASNSGSRSILTQDLALEFEQIRDYRNGDDQRMINWKATARSARLMVNQYRVERSQNIYLIVDTGRLMELAFQNMTLADYAVNATLGVAHVILQKEDRPGLLIYGDETTLSVKAGNERLQLQRFFEQLYALRPGFGESRPERLYQQVRIASPSRAAFFLFTNFESVLAAERAMPVFLEMSRRHKLIVFLFRNTQAELDRVGKSATVSDIYKRAAIEEYLIEKEQIQRLFIKSGIPCMLARPEELSIQAINSYLSMVKK
ncbi:MAG: DUF58 domain-containing protein [Balneolales bacterium]|nr:DUF58 domain-containing protein [Balneolales bacterium]